MEFMLSQIQLSWFRSSPYIWKTFVANRLSHIQESVPPEMIVPHVDYFHLNLLGIPFGSKGSHG